MIIKKNIKGVEQLNHELRNCDPKIKSCLIPRQHRVQLIRSRKESHEFKNLSRERGIEFILQ